MMHFKRCYLFSALILEKYERLIKCKNHRRSSISQCLSKTSIMGKCQHDLKYENNAMRIATLKMYRYNGRNLIFI